MGAVLALRLAADEPKRVAKVVLIGMPVYADPVAARHIITNGSSVKRMILYGPVGRVCCFVWCRILRPFSSRIAPFYLKRLPKYVARSTVLHTWRSYSQSLEHVIERQDVAADLARLQCQALLVYGSEDIPAALDPTLQRSTNRNRHVLILNGGHQLPVEQPKKIAAVIQPQCCAR
jgi:pimeloyl-ACP methyl ester carboxylesterase